MSSETSGLSTILGPLCQPSLLSSAALIPSFGSFFVPAYGPALKPTPAAHEEDDGPPQTLLQILAEHAFLSRNCPKWGFRRIRISWLVHLETARLISCLQDTFRSQSQKIDHLRNQLQQQKPPLPDSSAENAALKSELNSLRATLQASEEKQKEIEKEREDLLVFVKGKRDKARLHTAGMEISEDEAEDEVMMTMCDYLNICDKNGAVGASGYVLMEEFCALRGSHSVSAGTLPILEKACYLDLLLSRSPHPIRALIPSVDELSCAPLSGIKEPKDLFLFFIFPIMTAEPVPPSVYFPNASDFEMHNPQFMNAQNIYINESSIKHKLQAELKPITGAHLNPDKICLKGTRVGIIADILAWIHNPDNEVPKVFFLCGEAGTGKSTISHTIGQKAKDTKCLGAFFCFDRTLSTERTPSKALQTIAYDLSISFPEFGKGLVEVLDADPNISSSMSLKEQWNKLIMAPAKCFIPSRPVVIIIDALDECGPKEEGGPRDVLLSLLTNSVCELPKNFHVLVTSRMESDVHVAVNEGSAVQSLQAQYMSNLQQTQEDIHKYVVHRMMTRKGASGVLNESQCQILAEKAQGFFQWAYTACEALHGRGKAGLTVKKRFERFMSLSPSHGQDLLPLDKLYRSILEDVFDCDDSEAMAQYRMVMAQILAAFEPLSSLSLKNIQLSRCRYLGEDYDDEEVDAVIQFLGSLLTGIIQRDTPIRLVHTSIHDFLVDEKRSGEYAVKLEEGHQILAMSMLHLMITDLHFNMCNLESSYLLNSQVENLAERIIQNISPDLSYACLYWGSHIIYAQSCTILDPLLRRFFTEVLLFWMEVLSILGKVDVISETAGALLDYGNSVGALETDILREIQQFIQIFGRMIGSATPHLYLSGVPFLPKDSVICQQFMSQLDKSLVVCRGQRYSWPAQQAVLTGHKSWVNSVTFSPDGKRIVSGSEDYTVRIWNAETGMIIGEPLQGHTDSVNSVACSPDGKRIVSGSEDYTVRIWNAETGMIIGEPLQGHTFRVKSVAFSPDGKRIVSGALDKTLRIWNAETGMIIGEPLRGHTEAVYSVAFSPDGKRIVSGSSDKTVRIWNAETGMIIGEPLQGHTSVYPVAFSPDGKRIVSGSSDKTVCIWNAETGMIIGEPLQGHTSCVFSVAFSPDGKRIVSGSCDKTVCIWNAETGMIIGEPLQGHTHWVNSVAFSPDGKRIVSGSYDKTVCIWNAETRMIVGESPQGHTDSVNSVAFSPDGKRIVSGSSDKTVCIWNAETGMIIGEPLQGHKLNVNSVAFSSDGKRIVSGCDDQTVCIWNAETGIIIGEPLQGHTDWYTCSVQSVAFSPNGKRIISSSDKTVRIWNAETGMIIGEPLQGHRDYVRSVAFSPDGKRIVSGSDDKTVCIWNAETGMIIGEPLQGHTDSVNSVAFSPDGKRIVSGSSDKTVRIWNAETGMIIGEPLQGHTFRVKSVAFSPDGKRIVSGSYDWTVCIWNAETGMIIGEPLQGHTSNVNSVAFSPNGKRIVSGSLDETVRIWNAETGMIIGEPLQGYTSSVNSVTFPSDGKRIVSGSWDHTVCIETVTDSDMSESTFALSFCPWHPDHHLMHTDSLLHGVHLNSDGWICSTDSSLLLWIPPAYRPGLMFPNIQILISRYSPISLDLSNFVYGKDWVKCFKAKESEGSPELRTGGKEAEDEEDDWTGWEDSACPGNVTSADQEELIFGSTYCAKTLRLVSPPLHDGDTDSSNMGEQLVNHARDDSNTLSLKAESLSPPLVNLADTSNSFPTASHKAHCPSSSISTTSEPIEVPVLQVAKGIAMGSMDEPEGVRRLGRSRKRVISDVLSECTCGIRVLAEDKEGEQAAECTKPGCETVWFHRLCVGLDMFVPKCWVCEACMASEKQEGNKKWP
ncbi:WD40 repeat-like protein [Gymnopus androsaceus JB14]|uniref:WD40 repeat-like protein n=1 Tax=Gymnopus androsaceus JB14 TaxID=1447944 RepID=A0A6A4HV83_9AGAR|nr:WD40 repeat-like protein [Gymnopus androsaceus JB14]